MDTNQTGGGHWQMGPAAPGGPSYIQLAPSQLKEIGALATAVMSFVGASISLALVDVVIEYLLYGRFSDANSLGDVQTATWDLYDQSGLLALLSLICFIGGGITTMILMKRMADNAAMIRPDKADHKSHWAIWGWLVPFLNLVRPYQMMEQIWRGSFRSNGQISPGLPPTMKFWWAAFIGMNIIGRAAPSAPWTDATLSEYRNESVGLIFVSALTVAAGVLYMLTLRTVVTQHRLILEDPMALPNATPIIPATYAPPPTPPFQTAPPLTAPPLQSAPPLQTAPATNASSASRAGTSSFNLPQ